MAKMPIAEIVHRVRDLSPPTAVLIVASTVFAVLIVEQFRSRWRLRHIPGPFWSGFSILPWLDMSLRHDTAHRQLDLQRKYGDHFLFHLYQIAS